MTDYRAEFDAEVTVLNGGGLQAQRFRLDISSPDVSEPELAAAFVRQLGLLMTDQVGADLAGLPLDALADLPAVVVRVIGRGSRGIGVGALAALDVAGCAVLLHTGWDRFFGTPAYSDPAPYLTVEGARWLVDPEEPERRHPSRGQAGRGPAHHRCRRRPAPLCDAVGVVDVTDTLLGAVAVVAVGSLWGALHSELSAADRHSPIHVKGPVASPCWCK